MGSDHNMATWLTHLRVAEKIKERIRDIDLDYFMAGSIAPDSGKKEITHFCKGTSDEDRYIDLNSFYNKYLRPEELFTRSDKTRSFYWGYYFHLIGDSLWNERYLRPMTKECKDGNSIIHIFREEMYALDFEYLEKNSENNILSEFQSMEIKLEFFNGFSPHQIYENIKKINDYYRKENHKLNREFKFLDAEAIERFIDITVEKAIAAFYE
ncbi:zinc dependent phospholipase C family protein [Lutispora saccharofermentans]|uniref:Phospholipase C/D domain-containing protein n=1 Tax=Lutispora saccharofermentans TaxID=3024236 RepID=A0ABT1NKN7_9FIRM|nr:zinc dependent phospholipase C family protein [Lutispora saccharofermentans]MCQ1531837.1 hypothetical protein [Lutispora saccharofermentans]